MVADKYMVEHLTSSSKKPAFAVSLSCSQDNLAKVKGEKILVRPQL
jgi:hypothetical protein